MVSADDRLAVIDVVHRWSHIADGPEPTGLDAVLTDDAVYEVAGETPRSGRDAIAAGMAQEAATRTLQPRRHVRNTVFVETGDDRVVVHSYFLLTGVGEAGLAQALNAGVYEDEVVRTDAGWRIRHRLARPDGPGANGLRA